MIKKIRRKLKSETGASISFALMLFLICAAIGSIVLNAGTNSTSKLIDRATMDKRYYEVTSAAEFLKERFEGEGREVVIERTKTNDTYTFSCDGTDLSTLFAKALLENTNNDATMWNSDFYHSANFETLSLHFVRDGSDTNVTDHTVSIEPKVVNGVVVLDIKSTDGKYLLKMTLTPDIKETTSISGNTEKKLATIKFVVTDIKKVF